MEEDKKNQKFFNKLIWWFGILVLFLSFGGLLYTILTGDKNGEFDVMAYDREKGILLVSDQIAKDVKLWFWLGVGMAIALLVYAVLREVPKWKKVTGGLIASMLLVGILFVDGLFASFAYVDVGIGLMPTSQVSEEGGGEFIRSYHKMEKSVQVYVLLGDKAYRVDGYDPVWQERKYSVRQATEILLSPWEVTIDDGDGGWTKLIYENHGYDY